MSFLSIHDFERSSPSKHKWSPDEREALCLIKKLYDIDDTETTLIWNLLYKSRLRDGRFGAEGYPKTRIVAQLHELRHGGTGSHVWQRISRMNWAEVKAKYGRVKDDIEDVAQKLGVVLKLKVQSNHVNVLPSTPKKKVYMVPRPVAVSADWTDTSSEGEYAEGEDGDEDEDKGSSSKTRKNTDVSTTTTTRPRISPASLLDKYRYDPKTGRIPPLLRVNSRPALLFRAYQPTHRFRARKFLESDIPIPSPPVFSTIHFRNEVEPHLRRDPTYASPFISFAQNPLTALKYIIKNQEPRRFAIFDYFDIQAECERRHGDTQTQSSPVGPYLVRQICRVHQLNDLPGRYLGVGEFLVYGNVECQAAATLSHQDAHELYKVMKAVKKSGAEVGDEVGLRIGRCLRDVCDRHKEIVAYKLLRSFEIPGYQRRTRGQAYEDFVDAVYATTQGERAASIFSTIERYDLSDDDDENDDPNKDSPMTSTSSASHDCDEEKCPCVVEVPHTPSSSGGSGSIDSTFLEQLQACIQSNQSSPNIAIIKSHDSPFSTTKLTDNSRPAVRPTPRLASLPISTQTPIQTSRPTTTQRSLQSSTQPPRGTKRKFNGRTVITNRTFYDPLEVTPVRQAQHSSQVEMVDLIDPSDECHSTVDGGDSDEDLINTIRQRRETSALTMRFRSTSILS